MFNFFKKKTDIEIESYQNNLVETKSNQADYCASFEMIVQDVFTVGGRGTIACGEIQLGVVKLGDKINVLDYTGKIKFKTVIGGIEVYKMLIKSAHQGQNAGLLLKGVSGSMVTQGDVLSK